MKKELYNLERYACCNDSYDDYHFHADYGDWVKWEDVEEMIKMYETKKIEQGLMFEKAYTGINDINNNPIHNGMNILIIDKNKIGIVRYSLRRCGFRIFLNEKKPQEDKTYSVANGGSPINKNLKTINE